MKHFALKEVKDGYVTEVAGSYGSWTSDKVSTTLGEAVEDLLFRFCTKQNEETGEAEIDTELMERVLQDLCYTMSSQIEKARENKEEK